MTDNKIMTEREQEIQVSLYADKMLRQALDINNKLIAEFMGGYTPYERFGDSTEYYYRGDYVTLENMKFQTSWDWLMPVVEKIESLGYVFTIQGGKAEYGEMISEARCFIAKDKLSSTYQAVVEFIKLYNNED